jgi:hypothetical protein
MSRRLALLILLWMAAQMLAPVAGRGANVAIVGTPQPGQAAAGSAKPVPKTSATDAAQSPATTDPNSNCNGGPCGSQPPQIVVNSPSPANPPWAWYQRVAWAANIVLAVLGYVGIMLALRTLKNIERHAESNAAAVQVAQETASAALAQSQALVDSERPWIVVSVEPFLTMENSFKVMATNRGRTPARIVSTVDQVEVAADETHLAETPEFESVESGALPNPIILLPGESVGIRPFRREDVRAVCENDAQFERIELWQEKVFLFGRVTYMDMLSSPGKQVHETDWCCWYVHGEKESALLVAGPPEYNRHS